MDIRVRELQRGLYRAAKANRRRNFYTLRDKIYRKDVLWEAWQRVKANGGAPGIDGVSIEQIGEALKLAKKAKDSLKIVVTI